MIDWTGNLKDDCRAIWHDIYMHCEEMDRNYWWWAIYDSDGQELDSSNNYPDQVKKGSQARALAEEAAKKHIFK